VDVICSALPAADRSRQRPSDPLYTRYAGFADLDALFYVRVHLAQGFPAATIRDFHPGEYYNAEPDSLIILGAPDRNTAYCVEPRDTSVQILPRERRIRAGCAFESGGRGQISLGREYVTSWGRFAVPLVCHGPRPALLDRVGTARPGR
jgi:hypothetical protein